MAGNIALVCATVCTGVGKWLHAPPSYPWLGEPQGFSSGMPTKKNGMCILGNGEQSHSHLKSQVNTCSKRTWHWLTTTQTISLNLIPNAQSYSQWKMPKGLKVERHSAFAKWPILYSCIWHCTQLIPCTDAGVLFMLVTQQRNGASAHANVLLCSSSVCLQCFCFHDTKASS